MYQPWMFAGLVAAGTGLVALTVKLQQPPTPPVVPESSAVEAVHVVPPPVTVAEPVAPPVLELEPIVIEGHRAVKPPPAAPAVPAVSPAERPCSDWRDLGPTSTVSTKTDSESRVRVLCQ
jgi:hypothetical protein